MWELSVILLFLAMIMAVDMGVKDKTDPEKTKFRILIVALFGGASVYVAIAAYLAK